MLKEYTFTEADKELALKISFDQHHSSGARGTRDAGANLSMRLKGVKGEIAVARMLGIKPQARDWGGPDPAADITTDDGLEIEVKNGLPMEGRDKLKDHALYIVVTDRDHPNTFKVTAMAYGHEIRAANLTPPEWMCPRPGTQRLNYLITTGS